MEKYGYENVCFNPLWINTALKQAFLRRIHKSVSIPYGLTLLSNLGHIVVYMTVVSIPYGLTLLSNEGRKDYKCIIVSIPYGLTLLSNVYDLF